MRVQVLASGSKGNAYRVSYDGVAAPILLECGVGFKRLREALGFQVSSLAACLISHEHGDHAKAARDIARAGVDLYASAGTLEALGLSEHHRAHAVRAHRQFRIGGWTILPFEAIHDAAEPLGFLLVAGSAKLLYLTDSAYCRYRFQGLTHILAECNYDLAILKANVEAGRVPAEVKSRVIKSHMNIDTLLGFLAANDLSRVEEIVLLHLSDGNADAAEFKRRVERATGRLVRVADERSVGNV